MRVTWYGPVPALGEFFKSPKGRTAYEVLAIRALPTRYQYAFKLERWKPADVPEGAVVHGWRWFPRESKPRPHGPATGLVVRG